MASLTLQSSVSLSNGRKMPMLGFGVWDSPADLTTASCSEALKAGYSHIDTAQVYGNENEVGAAVRQSGLSRGDVFVTTKIFSSARDISSAYDSLAESIAKVGANDDGVEPYADLVLIHNVTKGPEVIKAWWLAMEKLYGEGKTKSIGVSNFGIGHIESMKQYASIWPPMVNQLELHPWNQQAEIDEYCKKNNIVVQAYCPIVRNQKSQDETLQAIASKHSKSTVQVLLRYCLQKQWVPLPKSDNAQRIRQNADIFDFKLDGDDMARLDASPQEDALVVAVDNSVKWQY